MSSSHPCPIPMPQIEWFYAKNDQPCGPVSPVELKKFADEGELHAEDLVWREGMGEWIPAGKIKGLFDSNGDEVVQEEPASKEMPTAPTPPTGEVPAGAIPGPPVAAAELPIRAAPPSEQAVHEAEQQADGSAETPAVADAELEPFRHPFDALADLAREQFDSHFVHSTVVLFRVGGQIGSFLTIVATLSLAVAIGSKTGTLPACMQLAAAGVLSLLLSQYAAARLIPATETLDRTSRAVVSMTGPLDSFAWMMTAIGLLSLVGLAALAIAKQAAWPAFLALGVFVVFQFAAVVAWNPRAMWLDTGPVTTAGREAAALLCFLGKFVWRLCVVAYGSGIVLGTIATLNVAVHIGLPDAPSPTWFTTELWVPLYLLLFALPLPVVGYSVFLVLQLLSELALAGLGNARRNR